MFLKYFLIGLGSAGVVGGGGYMIYNATKSNDSKEETQSEQQTKEENSEKESQPSFSSSSPQEPSSGDQSTK